MMNNSPTEIVQRSRSVFSFLGRAVLLLVLSVAGCNGSTADPAPVAASGAADAPKVAGDSTANSAGQLKKGSLAGSRSKAAKPSIVPAFSNVASDSGIDFTFFSDTVPDRYFLPEVMGGGVAWIDFDGDGWQDLYVANGCPLRPSKDKKGAVEIAGRDADAAEHVSQLYRNRGDGTFARVTESAAASHLGYGQGLAVGDFDADGFPDLFYSCFGADVLLHNQGDGTFVDVTATAGTTDTDWSTSCVWFDVDDDGDLDLYVVNYLDITFATHRICMHEGKPRYCGPDVYNAVADRLYVSQGDGTFVEQSDALGFNAVDGKGLAISVLDFDNDLRPEVYVANDMAANFLFTRSQKSAAGAGETGTTKAASQSDVAGAAKSPASRKLWAEVAMESGCAVSNTGLNEASMGLSCADFDGDGLADIYITHFMNAKNTLYHNMGQLLFVDDSYRTRAAATSFRSLGFGTIPFDYDGDGFADLFIANGHVQGPNVTPYAMTPLMLWNDGTGSFDDISEFAGPYFQDLWVGRAASSADYDGDGDLDLAVTHLDRPLALLRNDTVAKRHYLGLEVRTRSRIPPVGGRVVVTTKSGRQTLPIQAGGSYLGTSDVRLLFTAGDSQEVPEVEIHWPSGQEQKLSKLAADRYWIVYEGEEPIVDLVRSGTRVP